jgi:phenylpropionate dioxygenase-like ring-hydroxylating dioxygenase large terminal subunit
MLSQEENHQLTAVGGGTPAGELLRRYWHPIAPAVELTDEKPKKKIRVLGEDLVLYRDRNGGYGLVGEHCSHRGVSLYYGFVEDDGIRCPYHGWKYDAAGNP